jgi:8-oxo-dGTP diphosphatase
MEIGVFAFIKNPEGKILLVKDVTRQQLWTLPGGGPEIAELMPDTLVREVKEETSVDVGVGQLLGVFSQKKAAGVVLLFEAHITDGIPTPDGVEAAECKYFSLEELLEIRNEVKPAQLSMVNQVENTKTFPIFNNFLIP